MKAKKDKSWSPRVSLEVAEHILRTRPEKYVLQKLPNLARTFNNAGKPCAVCRSVMAMDIDGTKYLMICSRPFGHHGMHEDVDGGVYWNRSSP